MKDEGYRAARHSVKRTGSRALEPRELISNLRALVGLMLDPVVFAVLEQEVTGTA